MSESGRVQVEISPESADAVAKVSEMKTSWAADPTMTRGAKKVRERQGDLGHAHGHGARKRNKPVMTLSRKRKHEEAEDPEPTEQEPLTHVDYRKNSKGEKAIRRKLGEIRALDAIAFPDSKSFDPETQKCRLKADGAQDLVWESFLDHAPGCLTCLSLLQHLFRTFSNYFDRFQKISMVRLNFLSLEYHRVPSIVSECFRLLPIVCHLVCEVSARQKP